MMHKETAIIVATTTEYGIGMNNTIPWNIPEDLRNFRKVTTDAPHNKMNCVIMGRKTWESLPLTSKPLKNRINIIISKTLHQVDANDDIYVQPDINSALSLAYSLDSVDKIFIIGGAQIYNEVLTNYHTSIDKIYLSIIYDRVYKCDTFLDICKVYNIFDFDKENIHLTERYMYMIGYNKAKLMNSKYQIDENPD
jgi:dihydrofolate reductase